MLTDFLIFCSGSDKGIIAQCPQSERIKYASIGATVLLTGVLAAISSGYALYTIFRGEAYAFPAAILFGLIWATIIFNLDRYIVSSLRKEGKWKRELLYALPRFIIAILISLVIAKPLEVRIFANRIEQQILEDKRNKLAEEKLNIDKLNDLTKLDNTVQQQNSQLKQIESLRFSDPPSDDFKTLLQSRNNASEDLSKISQVYNPRIADYNNKINAIHNNADNYLKDSSLGTPIKLRPAYVNEVNTLSYNRNILINEIGNKRRKLDDIDAEIKKARDDYHATIAQKINNQNTEIEKTKRIKNGADSLADEQLKESLAIKEKSYNNNFITQVEALGHLNSNTFTTMWWTSILIMLLFMVIETAPIFVKLLSKRGPYDELLDRIEYEHYVEQQRLISDKNDEINHLLEEIKETNKLKSDVRIKSAKARMDAELNANESLLDDIAKRQADLAKIAVEKWYNDELSKFKNDNKSQYTQTNSQPNTYTLSNKLWKAANLQGNIFYIFNNGQTSNNELIYIEGGNITKGSWDYIVSNKEITIHILNNTQTYVIEELTKNTATLKTPTNDYLELIEE